MALKLNKFLKNNYPFILDCLASLIGGALIGLSVYSFYIAKSAAITTMGVMGMSALPILPISLLLIGGICLVPYLFGDVCRSTRVGHYHLNPYHFYNPAPTDVNNNYHAHHTTTYPQSKHHGHATTPYYQLVHSHG